MMKQKLTAILTAVICAGSVLHGLSTAASEKEVNGTFIVVAVDQPEAPEHYILKDASDYTTYFMSDEILSTYMTEEKKLACGDILQVYTEYCSTLREGTNRLDFFMEEGTNSQAAYAGSIYDNAEFAEFTVRAENKTANSMHLEKEGKTFLHNVDFLKYGICQPIPRKYIQTCDVDLNSLHEGDKVTMLIYEGQPVLPYSADPLGDMNRDGSLDVLDVIIANRHILGAAEFPSTKRAPGELGQADFNKNGKIDADDSLGMLKRIVGLE